MTWEKNTSFCGLIVQGYRWEWEDTVKLMFWGTKSPISSQCWWMTGCRSYLYLHFIPVKGVLPNAPRSVYATTRCLTRLHLLFFQASPPKWRHTMLYQRYCNLISFWRCHARCDGTLINFYLTLWCIMAIHLLELAVRTRAVRRILFSTRTWVWIFGQQLLNNCFQ